MKGDNSMNDRLSSRINIAQKIMAEPRFGTSSGYCTAVQDTEVNIYGGERPVRYVWQADNAQTDAYTPLLLLPLHKLLTLSEDAPTEQVHHELQRAVTLPGCPPAPLASLLLLTSQQHPFADLVYPPAVMGIVNAAEGDQLARQVFRNLAIVVPYTEPVWCLAAECAEEVETSAAPGDVLCLLVPHVGVIAIGHTPDAIYERLAVLVEAAEAYLHAQGVTTSLLGGEVTASRLEIANLRARLSRAAGRPLALKSAPVPVNSLPDDAAVDMNAAPDDARVIIDPQRGMFAAGDIVVKAQRALETAKRDAQVMSIANQLGGAANPPAQAARGVNPQPPPHEFDGEVVLITGAASGIGKTTAQVFMERGAAVVGMDINPAICNQFDTPQFHGVHGDVTVIDDVRRAVDECVKVYGGLDVAFLNAGINEDHNALENADLDLWNWVMKTNLDANLYILKEIHPLLKLAPKGGRVVMNASKSAVAPGPGSSSYTISKMGLTQLGRITALEWGKDNIRVNVVHPNAVFDTNIWKDNMAEKRARHYGMTLQEYKTNNLLKVEMNSRDVGEIVADLCGDHFRKVTGAQLPIDGGNTRVI